MEIKQFVWDAVDSNSWLILEGKRGLLIDAVDNEQLYDAIKELEELIIILTHSHFDHIIGLNRIRAIKPCSIVIATERCSEYIGNIYRNMSASANAFLQFYENGRKSNIIIEPFTCSKANILFSDTYEFQWCNHNIELSAYHGHSLDSLIAIVDKKIMFSGDTILPIPTITRLPKGNTRRFREEDLPKLKNMNNITTVYPGHKMPGNLQEMIEKNGKTWET